MRSRTTKIGTRLAPALYRGAFTIQHSSRDRMLSTVNRWIDRLENPGSYGQSLLHQVSHSFFLIGKRGDWNWRKFQSLLHQVSHSFRIQDSWSHHMAIRFNPFFVRSSIPS